MIDFNIGYGGSLGTSGGYLRDNGVNDDYYHRNVNQVPVQNIQPSYGSYGGSQSSANANANANSVNGGALPIGSSGSYYPVPSGPQVIGNANPNPVTANGGNSGIVPIGPSESYYPVHSGPKVIGNANANANAYANAAAKGSGSVNLIPEKYPSNGIEIIPVDTLPISQPNPPVRPVPHHRPHPRPIPQGVGKGGTVIPIVIVEDSPAVQYPQYQRPGSYYGRPHYGGKPKQQPIEVIVIEETVPSHQGDTS